MKGVLYAKIVLPPVKDEQLQEKGPFGKEAKEMDKALKPRQILHLFQMHTQATYLDSMAPAAL